MPQHISNFIQRIVERPIYCHSLSFKFIKCDTCRYETPGIFQQKSIYIDNYTFQFSQVLKDSSIFESLKTNFKCYFNTSTPIFNHVQDFNLKWKKLSFCHKLWVSNFNIVATQCRRPLIFQTSKDIRSNNVSLKYQKFTS